MAWRFRKSFKIAPGVRLNVSKKGLGVSAGVKGARVGISPSGRTYTSVGVPGTGLHAISYSKSPSRVVSSGTSTSSGTVGCLGALVAMLAWLVARPFYPGASWAILAVAVAGLVAYSLSTGQKAKRLLRTADNLIQRQEYEAALVDLQQADFLRPSDDTKFTKAALLNDLKRFAEARPILSKLLEKDPGNDTLLILLANANLKTKNYEDAIRLAQSVPESSSWRVKSISLVGSAYAEQGKYELAIEALKTAPTQKRNLDDDLKEIHYNIAECYRESGNKKKAEQHYRRIAAQDAGYADVSEKLKQLEER